MKHVVNFSGGKDSTAMLLMMIEKGMPVHKIICVDTTKEFPEMYAHIGEVQRYIKPMEIEIVRLPFDYWFAQHVKTKGRYKGEAGYGWPCFQIRWCTALKRDKIKLALAGVDAINYIGIAADEYKRHDRHKGDETVKMPLVEWGITEAEALQYCYDRGFTWGGLYKKFARVSCFCCPMQRIGELRTIYNDHPDLWLRIKEMDKLSPRRRFRPRETVADLERRFEKEKEV